MKPLHTLAAALAAATFATVALTAPTPATAALVDRGGGLVYDTVNDITWLAAPALLPGQLEWADGVLYGAAFEYAGGTNWRTPTSSFIDAGCPSGEGLNCSDSEMARLFYQQLGGQAGESVFDTTGDSADEIAAVALLPALMEGWFWSGQAADEGSNTAFAFHFGTGTQAIRDTTLTGRVLLVHAGDLGAMAVDAPPTLPLVLAATAIGALVRRRRPVPVPPPAGRRR